MACDIVFGLTGGIGCGKSTVSNIFREHGALIWDADRETHNLYQHDMAMIAWIAEHFPAAMGKHRRVDRVLLGDIVLKDDAALEKLTTQVGLRLQASISNFFRDNALFDGVMVLDVPLLFEADMQDKCDEIIVVHCPPEVQRERVLSRGMSPEKLDKILSLQWTDAQRFPLATHLINTDRPKEEVREDIEKIIRDHLR